MRKISNLSMKYYFTIVWFSCFFIVLRLKFSAHHIHTHTLDLITFSLRQRYYYATGNFSTLLSLLNKIKIIYGQSKVKNFNFKEDNETSSRVICGMGYLVSQEMWVLVRFWSMNLEMGYWEVEFWWSLIFFAIFKIRKKN